MFTLLPPYLRQLSQTVMLRVASAVFPAKSDAVMVIAKSPPSPKGPNCAWYELGPVSVAHVELPPLDPSCQPTSAPKTPMSSVTLKLMTTVHGQFSLPQWADVLRLSSLRVILEMLGGVVSMGSGVLVLTLVVGVGASMTVTVTLADASPPGPLATKV